VLRWDALLYCHSHDSDEARPFISRPGPVSYDSEPEREYHETLNKARALAEAVRVAEIRD
jgi:hypothetical protein